MTYFGGLTLFLSHMLHECGNSEVACGAAFTVLLAVARIVSFSFFAMTGAML